MKETVKNFNLKEMNNAIDILLASKGGDYKIVKDMVLPKMRDIRGNEYDITVIINGLWNCSETPDEYGRHPYTGVYRMYIELSISSSEFMAKNSDIDWDTPYDEQVAKYGEDKVNLTEDLIDDYEAMLRFFDYLGNFDILDEDKKPSEKLIELALNKISTEIKKFNKDKWGWIDKEWWKEIKEEKYRYDMA